MADEPPVPAFDIERLRADVSAGRKQLRITTHAQVEAAKDGLLLADLRHIFENGRVIETYPEDYRVLLYAITPTDNLPGHIVVEDTPEAGVIITAYVPDRNQWIANVRRRSRK